MEYSLYECAGGANVLFVTNVQVKIDIIYLVKGFIKLVEKVFYIVLNVFCLVTA